MKYQIKRASENDLAFLKKIEKSSFPDWQQNSAQSIKNSLKSTSQEVYVLRDGKTLLPLASLILHIHYKSIRIYSISVLETERGKGIGEELLQFTYDLAAKQSKDKVTLEAHSDNSKLIDWYRKQGFSVVKELSDYYAEGKHALKMEKTLKEVSRNIVVINKPNDWDLTGINAEVISVKEYIENVEYHSNNSLRIFNLCSSYEYQSFGYYVSLLASARGQRVIPSATTIRDFRMLNVVRSLSTEIEELIAESLERIESPSFEIDVYFGQSPQRGFSKLAAKLDQIFETPLFRVNFIKHGKWIIKDIKVLTLAKIEQKHEQHLYNFAFKYFNKKRFSKARLTSYKYDIAILTNPKENTPPSCSMALEQFKKAANKKGMYLEFIGKSDFDRINEFDALFIRETTSVNNHTYEFSRMAYAEGLVVIDDPWSILKCSNKIYQNELFKRNKVLTPRTDVIAKNRSYEKVLQAIKYPVVIKQPDSAFSLGISKAENYQEAVALCKQLFKKSDMLICQEFLYSDFDWRIGLMDNQALYACKYYMSKGHWQIYNWQEKNDDHTGEFETLDLSEVPEKVLKTALKAGSLIGDGLYGIDLKMIDNKVYVIEVNDNPNIDFGVEDQYLKEKLYDKIMESIYNRIEVSKNIDKFISK